MPIQDDVKAQRLTPCLSPSIGHRSLILGSNAVENPTTVAKVAVKNRWNIPLMTRTPRVWGCGAFYWLVHKGYNESKVNESISREERDVGRRLETRGGKNEAARLVQLKTKTNTWSSDLQLINTLINTFGFEEYGGGCPL